jgi:hypothetical protein
MQFTTLKLNRTSIQPKIIISSIKSHQVARKSKKFEIYLLEKKSTKTLEILRNRQKDAAITLNLE